MSSFDLRVSLRRAEERTRERRADAGKSRLHPAVDGELRRLLGAGERPAIQDVREALREFCRARGLRVPSRATLYNALDRVPVPSYAKRALPRAVQDALHNLSDDAVVPGDQVAFAAFNRGDPVALSWASALPWACLHAAAKLPGFRPKSRALLAAVMEFRGIR